MATKSKTTKKQLYEIPLDKNGLPITAYSLGILKELWDKTTKDEECKEVMKYITTYIHKTAKPIGYTIWEYDEQVKSFIWTNYSEKDLYSLYIPKFTKSVFKDGKVHTIKLRSVFENYLHKIYKFTVNFKKPLFHEVKGQHFINMFTGIPYDFTCSSYSQIVYPIGFAVL